MELNLQLNTFIDLSELDDIFGEMDSKETLETIEGLYSDFLLKLRELIFSMDKLDLDTFKLKAHSLKSNCCYLGANKLNKESYQLELTESFYSDEFHQHWESFNKTFQSTINEIKIAMAELQTKESSNGKAK